MPRGKAKSSLRKTIVKTTEADAKLISVSSAPILDLNMFKFEKKPHVKIEYEEDSPTKQEGTGLWEPPNWRDFLLNLRNMRANNDAPVDSMGCHKAMDERAPPKVMRYQSLLALMLSSQTKDQVTFAAMERLRQRGCTVDNILNMSDDELGKLIYPVGFWRTKVKYIKKTTETLKNQYDGDIPDSVDKLCKLTGVGPKMAHICMSVAWKKVTGIGVDTHVHRISNRIGWVKKPTTTPEDTRKALESWLPFDLWGEVNHLLVGFGQTICQPINPLCHECLNNDICPSSATLKISPVKKSPKKTPIKVEVKEVVSEDEFEVKPADVLQLPKLAPKRKNTSKKEQLSEQSSVTSNKVTTKTEKKNDREKENPSNKVAPKRKVTLKTKDLVEQQNTGETLQTETKKKKKTINKDKSDNCDKSDLFVRATRAKKPA